MRLLTAPCSFLGCIDLFGTPYKATTVATGFGAMIAQPLLRKHVEGREDTLTEAEAKRILEESMRVLFYRDARSLNKVCWPFLKADLVGVCHTRILIFFRFKSQPLTRMALELQSLTPSTPSGALERIFEDTAHLVKPFGPGLYWWD